MKRVSKEILKYQLELKETLKVHKIEEQWLIGREVELIENEIEIIKSQLRGKSLLEEITMNGIKQLLIVQRSWNYI